MSASRGGHPRGDGATDGLRVAMAVYGDLTYDSRVQREARALANAGHVVTIHCLAWSPESASRFDRRIAVVASVPDRSGVIPGTASPFLERQQASRLRRMRARLGWLAGYVRNLRAWGRSAIDRAGPVDVWHLHDFAALVAIASRVDVPFVYDVHDLFTETGTGRRLPRPMRWAAGAYEKRLARRAELVVAVNDGIAADVERRCQPKATIVVHNAVPRWNPPEAWPDLIRERLGLVAGTPIVLYHGILSQLRGLERLCEAMAEPELAGAHLVFLGYGRLRDTLLATAAEPRFGGRIHVLDAVSPEELLPWVASADVGAIALPAATRNLVLATPNKLFECVAAGTPPVVSNLPLMRRIVLDDPLGPLGLVCDPSDTRSVAGALAGILELDPVERAAMRSRCLAAAHERWNWETEVDRIVAGYAQLAGARRARASTGSRVEPAP